MYPIDSSCTCSTCQSFTRAYLNHLFRVGEILAATLVSVHNIAWFQQYMARMRQSIVDGTFEDFRKDVHEHYPEDAKEVQATIDLERPELPPKKAPSPPHHRPGKPRGKARKR